MPPILQLSLSPSPHRAVLCLYMASVRPHHSHQPGICRKDSGWERPHVRWRCFNADKGGRDVSEAAGIDIITGLDLQQHSHFPRSTTFRRKNDLEELQLLQLFRARMRRIRPMKLTSRLPCLLWATSEVPTAATLGCPRIGRLKGRETLDSFAPFFPQLRI